MAVEIEQGVRCIFHLYLEEIFDKNSLNEASGELVNGIPLKNLRCTDDALLLAENFRNMLSDVSTMSRQYGMILNVKKTNYVVVTKTELPNEDLFVAGEILKWVER